MGKMPTTLVRRLFFVEPFLGVVGPDLAPTRLGKTGEVEYLGAGLVEVIGRSVHTEIGEVVDHTAVLGPGRPWVGLGKDGSDHGGHNGLGGAWDLGQ